VGFYGGIDYGFGYSGVGYEGGYWDHDSFRYNRAVNNVNVTNITNVYNAPVVHHGSMTHVSYNGGSGGVTAQPTPQDRIAERERHTALLPVQAHHELAAGSNRALLASVNNGHPALAATPRPERFAGGPAPARSFSQQAAAQPLAAPRRNEAVGPNSGVRNGQPIERRNAPANPGAARIEAAPRAQAPVRAPLAAQPGSPRAQAYREAPVHSQGPGRPLAQMQPQAAPSQAGRPQREARVQRGAPDERAGERQHP
jgi:hypothetical protein